MQLPPYSRSLALAGAFFLVMALLVSINLGERTVRQRAQVFDITMSTAEQGGFSPANLQIQVGHPVTLRFHAKDVAHALAIGPGLDIDLGVIAPGMTREVTLTFDRSGVYTFYCNLWCSPEHWRMRGVIDVVAADGSLPPAAADPVIAALTAAGIDIDARHDHAMAPMAGSPLHDAAPDTAALASMEVGAELRTLDWQHMHTIAEAMAALGTANPTRSDEEAAGAAVALWMEHAQAADLAATADIYAKNCVACHGAQGRGDGPAAAFVPTAPAAFTVPGFSTMRSDVLYAKIRRGGMGTGMPNFGTLFTPEETWSLVDYLWQLAFDAADEIADE